MYVITPEGDRIVVAFLIESAPFEMCEAPLIDSKDLLFLDEKKVSLLDLVALLQKVEKIVEECIEDGHNYFQGVSDHLVKDPIDLTISKRDGDQDQITCWDEGCHQRGGVLLSLREITLINKVRKISTIIDCYTLHKAAEHLDFGWSEPVKLNVRELCSVLGIE